MTNHRWGFRKVQEIHEITEQLTAILGSEPAGGRPWTSQNPGTPQGQPGVLKIQETAPKQVKPQKKLRKITVFRGPESQRYPDPKAPA